jgi:hypothetical protein
LLTRKKAGNTAFTLSWKLVFAKSLAALTGLMLAFSFMPARNLSKMDPLILGWYKLVVLFFSLNWLRPS